MWRCTKSSSFSHDGKLLLRLGERAVAGNDTAHFNQPSDVAIAPDGSFYVSDGYGNNRIVKFGADGNFLLQWGSKGKNADQFDLPHALTFDRGRVYVLGRGNRRVQIFDSQGYYLTEWKGPPFASLQDVKIGRDSLAFVVQMSPAKVADASGILVMRSDGSLLERVGRYGNYGGQFLDVHWVAVARSGAVYTADSREEESKSLCAEKINFTTKLPNESLDWSGGSVNAQRAKGKGQRG